MTAHLIDLPRIVRENDANTFQNTIDRIADEGVEELTVAVHAAFDISNSEAPPDEKGLYLRSVKSFLEYCKRAGLKILHLRDMLSIDLIPEDARSDFYREREPSLFERYGIEADYEVATFFNFGVPIDLMLQYFEQQQLYGIFSPAFYSKTLVQVVNGIGCFSESFQCFTDGVSLMEKIAHRQVRVIRECVLPATARPYSLSDSTDKYGLSRQKVLLYSFTETGLVRA